MRHGAEGWDAEIVLGQSCSCAGKASDIARARGHQPCFSAMRAAQAEIDQQLAGRGKHQARRLGCDEGLEVQDVDDPRFGQLRLRHRRRDAQDGLVGEKDTPFRYGMHVAAEAEIRELVEQPLLEASCAGEPIDLLGAETEIFEEIERLFEAGDYQEASLRRQFAYKKFEDSSLRVTMIQVCLDHIELIKIRE